MSLSHKVAVLLSAAALTICPIHLVIGANEFSVQNANLSNITDPIKEISQQYKQETDHSKPAVILIYRVQQQKWQNKASL